MSRYLLAACLLATGAVAAAEYQIDSAHSSAQFSVRHMMVSNVRGEFGSIKGSAFYDPKDLASSRIEAVIDASTINTREPKRDAHLRGSDFFDVEKYPTLTFRSKRFERISEGVLKVVGDLTMRGVTKEVALQIEGPTAEIKDPRGLARMGATATGTLNRSDYGLTWNRALETGGVVVGDEVKIVLDVELIRK